MAVFVDIYTMISRDIFGSYVASYKTGKVVCETEAAAVKAILTLQTTDLLYEISLFISRSNMGRKNPKTVFDSFKPLCAAWESMDTRFAAGKMQSKDVLIELRTVIIPKIKAIESYCLHKFRLKARRELLDKIYDHYMYWSTFKIRETSNEQAN